MKPIRVFFNSKYKDIDLDLSFLGYDAKTNSRYYVTEEDMLQFILSHQPFEFTLSPTKTISVLFWPCPKQHEEISKLSDDQEYMLQTIIDDMKERYEKAHH